jgi:hypothetical protein
MLFYKVNNIRVDKETYDAVATLCDKCGAEYYCIKENKNNNYYYVLTTSFEQVLIGLLMMPAIKRVIYENDK